jgi:hypothetical protein
MTIEMIRCLHVAVEHKSHDLMGYLTGLTVRSDNIVISKLLWRLM